MRNSRLLLLSLVLLLGGCLPLEQLHHGPLAETRPSGFNTPRVSCFLNLLDSEGPAIRLEVAGIEILGDGLWFPVTRGGLTIDSEEIGAGQLFLGSQVLPPGRYSRVRLTVTRGLIRKADGGYITATQEPFTLEIDLAGVLSLEEKDSRTLLFTWDLQNSLEGNRLKPALTVTPPTHQLLLDLVFVSCPDIDTIFILRADKNWVVDSFGVSGRPTCLGLDPESSRQRLYVLASGERMIKVVDLSSFRVVDFFPIPLNDVPTYMTVGPGGQGAFLLDERSGYLSRMDLDTGRNIARVLLGYRPTYALYLDQQNLLAVSLSLSQKVLLLEPTNLATVGAIPTGNEPEGLLVSGNQLYIAEFGDNTVSVVDLDSRKSESRLAVGFGPYRLQKTENQIYVANDQDGSLSVLLPGQLGVIQEIRGLGRPQEMAFDRSYRRLYVADEEAAAIGIVDVNSNRLLGHISLGAKPFGLVVIQ